MIAKLIIAACVVVVVLVVIDQARASTYPSVKYVTEYAAMTKGADVKCVDPRNWAQMEANDNSPLEHEAFTWIAAKKVRYRQWICEAMADPWADVSRFAHALMLVAHESSHLRGFPSEAKAGCAELRLPVLLATWLYQVPFGSARSRQIDRWVRYWHSGMAADNLVLCK